MYGLKEKDLIQIRKKLEVQKDYLKNHNFVTQNGEFKSLLDVSFSANHSERYYAEIINKINTINDIIGMSEVDYQPVFLTITLDGFFRDFLKGDFKRYSFDKHSKTIPNNDIYGYLRDKISNKEKFKIKDLYNVLNFQLNRFRNSKPYQKIKKDGFKVHYIRVCEPHKKDGVPHLHLMLYIPKQYLMSIRATFIKYFPAPQNVKPLNTNNLDEQLKGFQWEIKSAPAYVLKYIFKSFRNVKEDKDLDYLQAWYIKNRILRVVTSHSLVPCWVSRKMFPLEKDWFHLTDIKRNYAAEWSKEDDYIRFEDDYGNIIMYDKGVYKKFYKDRLLKEFGTKKEDKPVDIKASIHLKYKKKIKEPKIVIDDIDYIMKDGKLQRLFIKNSVSFTSSIMLYKEFLKMERLDPDLFDLNRYALVKNELIKRNYIEGEILPLSAYATNIPKTIYYDDNDHTKDLISKSNESTFIFKKINY